MLPAGSHRELVAPSLPAHLCSSKGTQAPRLAKRSVGAGHGRALSSLTSMTSKTALPWAFLAEHEGAARAGLLPSRRRAGRAGEGNDYASCALTSPAACQYRSTRDRQAAVG